MKYWYLKNGDVVGPWSAEEIKKDEFFAEDCLVCPEDKAEQSEYWKTPQSYAQDFFPAEEKKEEPKGQQPQQVENTPREAEMAIPEDTPVDDIIREEIAQNSAESAEVSKEQEPVVAKDSEEEKNPFDTDRPQMAPNIEETISNHAIAPRLDADGDTLLEDIPAKAILSSQEEENSQEEDKQLDFATPSALSAEDTLDDAPILNIFERTDKEVNKTKEIGDISEHIYDTYGKDDKIAQPVQNNFSQAQNSEDNIPAKEEMRKKNRKIYLLALVMFILVAVALVLALFGSNEEQPALQQSTNQQQHAALPTQTMVNPLQNTEEKEIIDTPTTDASAFFAAKTDNTEQDRALAKVKKFVLPNSKNLEEYLSTKYAGYQTSWVADVLSGRNYYVHFYASKIRQEPIVYSFSIDLDKNEINGLNNLGMDLLVKGE